MGADIHWILERRFEDGSWEAVDWSRGPFARRNAWADIDRVLSDPRYALGSRSYARFRVFSNVRAEIENERPALAYDGFPGDASDFALFALADDDLHSHGYFTVGNVRTAVANPASLHILDEEERDDVRGWLRVYDELYVPSVPEIQDILFGEDYDPDTEEYLPQMKGRAGMVSAHERLALKAKAHTVLPLADDTVRFLIAYDN